MGGRKSENSRGWPLNSTPHSQLCLVEGPWPPSWCPLDEWGCPGISWLALVLGPSRCIVGWSLTQWLEYLDSLTIPQGWPFIVLVAQSCLTLCDPRDCSPLGSCVHGILQARILEWVAIPFSRGPSRPMDWTWVSHIADRFFNHRSHQGSPFFKGIIIFQQFTWLGSVQRTKCLCVWRALWDVWDAVNRLLCLAALEFCAALLEALWDQVDPFPPPPHLSL